jgi:hypothetical protein
MKASSVLDRAEFQLNDAGFTRWTKPELLLYLSEGQREAARLQPECTAKTASVKLIRGVTRHAMPADSGTLIDITRNMGSDGNTPGYPITVMDKETADRVDPKRHLGNGKDRIKHFSYNPSNSLEFETYPKSSATVDVYIEMIYSQIAPDLTGETDDLTVIDKYNNALTEYVLSRAFGKDAQYAGQDGRASKHFGMFNANLGLTTK